MKLIVQIEVSHDLLGVGSLIQALPLALESVAVATNAGVAATGEHGMQVQAPGTNQVAMVQFRMRFEETTQRIEDLAFPETSGEAP